MSEPKIIVDRPYNYLDVMWSDMPGYPPVIIVMVDTEKGAAEIHLSIDEASRLAATLAELVADNAPPGTAP